MNDILINQTHINAWDYLLVRLENVNAVSGVMGYFQAMTGFNPLHGFYNDGITKGLDRESFIRDKKDYGIGAWDTWYDKQSWWNLAKHSGYAMSSLESQLELFCEELKGITHKALFESLKIAENPEDAAELMYNLYYRHYHDDKNFTVHNDIMDYAHFFYTRFVHPKHTVRYVEITDEEAWVKTRSTFLAKKIGKVHKGETYQLITTSRNGKWFSVYFNGEIRWIRSSSGVVVEREETYGEYKDSNSK